MRTSIGAIVNPGDGTCTKAGNDDPAENGPIACSHTDPRFYQGIFPRFYELHLGIGVAFSWGL